MADILKNKAKYEYIVSQVVLKKKARKCKMKNLDELESVINFQAEKGYFLDAMSTTLIKPKKIHYTLVFKKEK